MFTSKLVSNVHQTFCFISGHHEPTVTFDKWKFIQKKNSIEIQMPLQKGFCLIVL